MATWGFGPLEFQLMLLRRMADYQPDLVEQAARTLGVPPVAVPAASRRWQAMIRSRTFPAGSDRHRLVLGRPETESLRPFGAVVSEVARWPLPLWPDLRFETISVPGGPVLQEWIVRPDPATAPALGSAADLTPWCCVVADIDHAFAPVRHEDGDAPNRWGSEFTAPAADGPPCRHYARFTWGLLQTVTAV